MCKSETEALSEGVILTGKKGKHSYEVMKVLGRGGFGITYLAQETVPVDGIPQTHKYTIKEFCLSDICTRKEDGSLSVTPDRIEELNEAKEEFHKEAEHLRELSHNGIVPVSEVFEQNGTVYYVMQYLGGTTLSTYIKENGALNEDQALDITCKVATALCYLHQRMMTHLDVKPENIMLMKELDGSIRPVLIDFGLSCHYGKNGKITSKVVAVGTSKGYSPMEQYVPEGVKTFTPQADIYALGATLFHMLTGKEPVISTDVTTRYIYDKMPTGISDRTLNALNMAMQKRKEDRPDTMEKFLQLLVNGGASSTISGGNVTERITKGKDSPKDDNNKKYMYIGFAAVALIIMFFMFGHSSSQEPPVNIHEEVVPTEIPTEETDTENNAATNQNTQTEGQTEQEGTNTNSNTSSGSNSNAASNTSGQSTPEPLKPETGTTTKVKDLGYAVYEGTVRNGKPDGDGKMTFKSRHVIDSFDPDKLEAESGDYVIGVYEDGHLISGKWYDANGNRKQTIYIGGQ